ncbi:F-box only protein 34 [Synchiropus splendidus]|uniref:F-box only protein 34 n=1 Tax=Synchiropus splendidus TaxID=270530 RepID=UPI00237DD1B3|nr:F-box only protein 34 [Synchiropus splendidus]XP_053701014.1 F-box only protein 34 [Synchiropus splendidus]
MHLKPCQSLVRPAGVQPSVQRSAAYASQPGALVRTCSRSYGSTLGGHADCRTSLFRDDEALLDLWTVIKPGHVREKIAIFAADVAGGLDPFSDRVSAPRATKAKGRWEQAINAKRRRRSGLQDPQPPAWGRGLAETAEDKVSVGKMVAFLERQVSQQQTGTKVVLTVQKNECRDRSEVKGEEPASVSVSNMVARLESECLRRRSTGDLSRSNSLRRSVGRVLLAVVDQAATPPTPDASAARPSTEAEEPPPGLLFLPPAGPPRLSCSQSERRAETQQGGARLLLRRVSASQDFLDKRQRLQRLLEPQPFLSVLPLHLLVQIFQLLPTQSLAALQCTCHYFKFVIQTYGIRPADSLWVSDPRYRDDPCKQCKKRYGRGDVSLCRWHHKPYCQALPYGPGYWMCCHEVRREAPGCNVGLHDNRWVPAFHSITVPIYRRLARP